jgi:hypothetical protein
MRVGPHRVVSAAGLDRLCDRRRETICGRRRYRWWHERWRRSRHIEFGRRRQRRRVDAGERIALERLDAPRFLRVEIVHCLAAGNGRREDGVERDGLLRRIGTARKQKKHSNPPSAAHGIIVPRRVAPSQSPRLRPIWTARTSIRCLVHLTGSRHVPALARESFAGQPRHHPIGDQHRRARPQCHRRHAAQSVPRVLINDKALR